MISGIVNSWVEAVVGLTVVGTGESTKYVDALIDTGYSGQLTLSPAIVTALQLEKLGSSQGTLANGSIEHFDVYQASVVWDGQARTVEIDEIDTPPLLGMALLERHSLYIVVSPGGEVVITPSP